MNSLLVFSAFLTIAVGVAHSYLGERYILIRLFKRTDLPRLRGSEVFLEGRAFDLDRDPSDEQNLRIDR